MNREVCEHFVSVDLPCDRCEKPPALRTAAQQALEALEKVDKDFRKHGRQHWPEAVKAHSAIAPLRAALAEPVQEPVAWAIYDIKHGGSKTLHWPEQHSPNGDPSQFKAVPLYASPLTEERNFCPRCGKRSFPDTIHTCTPPHGIGGSNG